MRLVLRRTPTALALAHPWPGTLRGMVLWLFGLAFIVLGFLQYIGTAIPHPTREYLAFALDVSGGRGWPYGVMFGVVGLFAVVSAYCHFDWDRVGYMLASTTAAVWAIVYACGWAFYHAPVRALGGCIIWALYSAILTTCARIPKVGPHRNGQSL